MNGRVVAVLAALTAVTAMAGSLAMTTAAQPEGWFRTGEVYRTAMGDSAAVAQVDGVPMTRGELRIAKALTELGNEKSPTKLATDDRAVLGRLIDQKSVVAEARRRGFAATPAETAAHIAEVQRDFRQSPQAAANLTAFLRGVGMTEADWFASEFARVRYAEVAMIGKLRAQVLQGLDPATATATWEQFEKTARATARVEILDPTLR